LSFPTRAAVDRLYGKTIALNAEEGASALSSPVGPTPVIRANGVQARELLF